MTQLDTQTSPLKSALFVDFDNIYIGLSKSDPQAAERFASDPARWLAWLEKGLPVGLDNKSAAPRQRSVLIRRCYPNPDAGFRRFRSFFTSAAFSVIDCPSMTRLGKNSSDIYMVMDILDTLNHKTYFDEFIIFSGDSDFMPVLLRLRAHDRRTTTLSIDFMPPAFKAACDMVISEEQFIEEALGVVQETSNGGNSSTRARISPQILKDMAARVYQGAFESGEVAGADLPDLLKDFHEFRDSNNWLGYGTSLRMAEVLESCEPRLRLVRLNPMMYKIILKSPQEEKAAPARKGSAAQGAPVKLPGGSEVKPGKAELARLREMIISQVKELVSISTTPILLARASQYVVGKLGPQVLESQWAGTGSFKRLLQGAGDIGLEITTVPEPGYIFDPMRHTPPVKEPRHGPALTSTPADQELENVSQAVELPVEDYLEGELPDHFQDDRDDDDEEEEEYSEPLPGLEEFIRRVSRVTGVPDLTPQQYVQVFRGMVFELQKISAEEKVYNTYQSSKSVSEWCSEHGTPVSRSDIVMIFKGIIFQDGVRFSKKPGSYSEQDLARVVLGNIKALCRRSRLELSEYELHLLDEWLLGGLEELNLEDVPDLGEQNSQTDPTGTDKE
jgi:uncharacterized LabA/DUF88 family protein